MHLISDYVRSSSVVEFMVRWVVGSIPPGGPIELLLNSRSRQCFTIDVCAILSVMHIKDPLLLIGKSSHSSIKAIVAWPFKQYDDK